mmetsp:Transcript_58757/g.140025  ORF Transcript_58757/g.140025 Transcript_58757/m.140025 type:complete len:487 (-) Transcript_58757:65-1525(-)
MAPPLGSPKEVETWLRSLNSLLPSDVVRALTEEVHKRALDGEAFGELVSSRTMLPGMDDVLRPNHMAMLRRCWKADYGNRMEASNGMRATMSTSTTATSPPEPQRTSQQTRVATVTVPGSEPANLFASKGGGAVDTTPTSVGGAQGSPPRPPALQQGPPDAADEPNESTVTAEPRETQERGRTDGRGRASKQQDRKTTFAPPPRAAATAALRMPSVDPGWLSEPDQSPSPKNRFGSPARRVPEMEGGGFKRPPQVPRLDLSSVKAQTSAEEKRLYSHNWEKPRKSSVSGQPFEAPRGFAYASAEDQQRIAEFYGFRDEGFISTMKGLRTDMVRPRLYVGSMADAAYMPLLESLAVTHVLNCAVEAQHRASPPYESKGIVYYQLPLQDTPEQAKTLTRTRFAALRNATRFVSNALKARREQDNVVLLHCVQGMSRSAVVACAYLMEYEGYGFQRALSEVRSRHPGCLTSQHWQEFLRKFDAELLRGL